MKIYLAGPLFTQAERTWNLQLARRLTESGHSVFLPQVEVKAIATLHAETIFRVNVNGVRSADAVVAVLDGADPDSGTSFECGLAFALGLPIVIVRTDFRAGGDALPGQKLAIVNLMLSEAAAAVVARTDPGDGLDELTSDLVRALESLPESLSEVGAGTDLIRDDPDPAPSSLDGPVRVANLVKMFGSHASDRPGRARP